MIGAQSVLIDEPVVTGGQALVMTFRLVSSTKTHNLQNLSTALPVTLSLLIRCSAKLRVSNRQGTPRAMK